MLRAKNRIEAESSTLFNKDKETRQETSKEKWREEIETLSIKVIEPSPFQPRMDFDQDGLNELASSISEHGLLHPIVVRKVGNGYQLIAGERRLRACKILEWDMIPAIVKILDDKIAAEMALIENLQRRDLHFLEEAEGYERLIAGFDLTQDELAKRIGKSQSSIANRLRLLKLDQEIRKIISREMISERHTRALLKLPNGEQQRKMIDIIVEEGLSVRQTEEKISNWLEETTSSITKQSKAQGHKKLIFKDIRLFTNSLKELTNSLTSSGLNIDYKEEENEDFYQVSVMIEKPKRGEQ